MTAVGKSLVDGLYAWSKLLRTGNFWTRTVLAIQQVVEDELRIIYSPPPEHVIALNKLVVELFFPRPKTRNNKPPSEKEIAINEALRLEYLTMVNGHPHGAMVHYCHASVGCNCCSRVASVRRYAKAAARGIFRGDQSSRSSRSSLQCIRA